jgi:primase-polymerase (primpol)-like protein
MDWSSAPVPTWRGPTDDQDLINRAMRSQSGPQALGRKASFSDLFMCDTEKLGYFFPPDPNSKSGLPYNGSSADSALAQSLAFWTGNDCERIERIMRLSGLVRDKWGRED